MAGKNPFEVVPLENPQDPLLALEPPQKENPFPPPSLIPELPIDIEGYKTDVSDSWIGESGMISGEEGMAVILVIQVA